jgi:D-alanine-D-alanine ligase
MLKINDDILKKLKRCNIALLYGGNSPEHDVSIQSAIGVYPILKRLCHAVYLIGITKNNAFYLQNSRDDEDNIKIIENYKISNHINEINRLTMIPGHGISLNNRLLPLYLAFPVTHGSYGEDGKLQGLLSICNIAACGCDTTSSSICMSKAHCSSILNDNGIATIKTLVFDKYNKVQSLVNVQKILGKKLFIKSETTGSSIGVHVIKGDDSTAFEERIADSFKYSERVLIQPLYENFREIECAVLENKGEIAIGGPGCVVKPTTNELLSYKTKYDAVSGAVMNTSPNLKTTVTSDIKNIAERVFRILHLSGYARVDLFLTEDDKIILNEINTLPGLTKTSHYPLLIEAGGIKFEDALALIIEEALDGSK